MNFLLPEGVRQSLVSRRRRRTAISKLKVLFLAEGATLAHVARPWALANRLRADRFEVTFARPAAFAWVTAGRRIPTTDLACQDAAVFARRLARGLPLYDYATLAGYVENDIALLDTHAPDLVIGDFRLSLSVSARLRSIPYATVCDAYWSPERQLRPPLPVLGFTRFAPIPIAALAFRLVSGLALRLHAVPMERLRARYGLPSLGFDLRRCYSDADMRLFANFPVLFPEVTEGSSAKFVGPLAWSPDWAGDFELAQDERALIYVTMGSSGDPAVLANLLPVLAQTGCRVVVATAGKSVPTIGPSGRIEVYDYVPGDLVCRHGCLVVCNGGSPTTNQALAHGVPVLGIARNMDQFLNMQAITNFGAGVLVRADRASPRRLRRAVVALLGDARYSQHAAMLARSATAQDINVLLTRLIERFRHSRNSMRAPAPGKDERAETVRNGAGPRGVP